MSRLLQDLWSKTNASRWGLWAALAIAAVSGFVIGADTGAMLVGCGLMAIALALLAWAFYCDPRYRS